LKDFFQASIENIDLNELENIFLPDSKKGNAGIKVAFKLDGQRKQKQFQFLGAVHNRAFLECNKG